MDCQGLRRFLVDPNGAEDDLVGVFTDEYRAHLRACRNCQGTLIMISSWKLQRRHDTERLRRRFGKLRFSFRLPRELLFQAYRRSVQLLKSTWPNWQAPATGG